MKKKSFNIFAVFDFFKKKVNKEITIFPQGSLSFSFRPFLLFQGVAVLLIALFSFIAIADFVMEKSLSESKFIKDFTVNQVSPAVAKGQFVKWSMLINRSDINSNQYLAKLPKSAKNIKIKNISVQEAKGILNNPTIKAEDVITQKERKKLADRSTSSSFTANLLSIGSFLIASAEDAVNEIVESVTQEVTETEDAKIVDLSDQVAEQAVEEKIEVSEIKEEKQEKEEDKKVEKEAEKEEKENKKEEESKKQDESEEKAENEESEMSKQEEEIKKEAEPEKAEEIEEELVQEEPTEEESPEEGEQPAVTETPETEPTVGETGGGGGSPSSQQTTEAETEVAEPEETAVPSEEQVEEEEIIAEEEFVEIEFETPAPIITEKETDEGKIITVSDPTAGTEQPQLINVLAYTTIPEIFKVDQEDKIQIRWQNNGDQPMEFHAYDLNENGKLDYVEWTVPHLSEQVFTIIFISKAFKLDEEKNIIEDIYDQVRYQDGVWSSLTNNQYIRVTFEAILDNTRDIAILAKATNLGETAKIEVYEKNGSQVIAVFEAIEGEELYVVYLTELVDPTDTFDLKIIGNVDVDYIVDATLYYIGADGGDPSVASNWTATNPTSCSGTAAAAPPGDSDIAQFDADCDNGATLTANWSVGAIRAATNWTGTVNMNGFNLTLSNTTLSSIWSSGTLQVSTGTLNAAGLSFGTFSGGTIDATNGNLDFDTALSTTAGSTGTLKLPSTGTATFSANFSIAGNSFTLTHNNGTVTFDGSSDQTFGPKIYTFNNVSHTGTGQLQLTNDLTLDGTFTNSGSGAFDTNLLSLTATGLVTVSAGEFKASTGTHTLNGGLTISGGTFTGSSGTVDVNGALTLSSGTLTAPSGTFTVSGNWAVSGSPTFTPGTNTVTFDATSTGKTITSAGTSFYNATFNGVGGGWTLQDATTISNALTITNGTLDAGSQTITLSGTTGTPFSNSGTFTPSTSTVSYTGNNSSGNTTVANVTYNNLTLNNSSETYDLAANTTVSGNLTITAGTLDTTSANNYNLTIGGNWSNSGTFTPNSGTVTFDKSSGTQTLTSGGTGSGKQFNNISHSGAGTLQLATNALQVNGTLTNSAGTFDANALSNTVTGLATVSGGTYTASTATQTFNGGLTISGGTFTGSSGTVDVNGALTLSSGTLTAPSGTFTVSGNWAVSGSPTFTPGTNTVTLDGTSGTIDITSAGTSFYNLTINDGGGTAIYEVEDAMDVDNNLTITGGTLDVKSDESNPITIGNNFTNSDTFTARSGTVTLDGTDQTITCGSSGTTFNNLTKTVTTAYTLTFTADQTCTVSSTLTLQGQSGALLSLRSSTSGTQWKIDPQGTKTVSYLDVKDSNNINSTAVSCLTTTNNCTNSGNNTNWTFEVAATSTSVPRPPSGVGEYVETIGDIPGRIAEIPEIIVEGARKIAEQVSKIQKQLADLIRSKKEQPTEIVTVPEEAPFVFQKGIELLPSNPIKQFALGPLPRELSFFTKKFAGLENTLKEIGISKVSDVVKLDNVSINLPGLTETANLSTGELEVGNLAKIESIPTNELPAELKERVPSEIVFAKTGDGLIDFDIALSINDKGESEQKIRTLSGKPLELVVKPDKPVKKIKGYLILKRKSTAVGFLQDLLEKIPASLLDSNLRLGQVQSSEKKEIEQKLVLEEFEYTDPDGDGIYTANIQSPVVDGEYEVVTVMNYEDPELPLRELQLIVVVDPEGYVYEQLPNGELRINNAEVSLYWQNPETKDYEIWISEKYLQSNPYITDNTGRYSFLVPEGEYYLKVAAAGYFDYQSDYFSVTQGSGVHMNIKMTKKSLWNNLIDWFKNLTNLGGKNK